MIRPSRSAAPLAALALAVVLAGCSSSTIDIPADAQVTPPPAVTATPDGAQPDPVDPLDDRPVDPIESAAVGEELDCATVLPVGTIETVLELPAGFVSAGETTDGVCVWAMAGNPSALSLSSATGVTVGDVTQQQQASASLPSDLGDAAFFLPADAEIDSAVSLLVLAGDRLLSVRSFVGDQEALETIASDALTVLGRDSA